MSEKDFITVLLQNAFPSILLYSCNAIIEILILIYYVRILS